MKNKAMILDEKVMCEMFESKVDHEIQRRVEEGKLENILDFLTYRAYKHNRSSDPRKLPEEWACVFENWEKYEKLYQEEKR